MKKTLSEKDFKNSIKNKKIFIVGPSVSMQGSGMGSYIDSFDFVARIGNFHSKDFNKKDFGSRTDIVYHCFGTGEQVDWPEPDTWKNIPFVVFMPKPLTFEKKLERYFENFDYNKFYQADINWVRKITKESKCHLHTGTLAILHLLECEIQSLDAAGFTFYQDGYVRDYKNWSYSKAISHSKKCGHDTLIELNYFREKIKKYNNINFHGKMKKIVT